MFARVSRAEKVKTPVAMQVPAGMDDDEGNAEERWRQVRSPLYIAKSAQHRLYRTQLVEASDMHKYPQEAHIIDSRLEEMPAEARAGEQSKLTVAQLQALYATVVDSRPDEVILDPMDPETGIVPGKRKRKSTNFDDFMGGAMGRGRACRKRNNIRGR